MFERLPYRHIVAVDFEFEFGGHSSLEQAGRSGERPRPVCMVAKELRTGQTWQLWRGEFGPLPPFPLGPESLCIAFYGSAEFGCFRALGWSMPVNILDLYTEFRDRTNGLRTPAGSGLIGALAYFGLDAHVPHEKDRLRLAVLRGGPWSDSEREEIISYCASDVFALERLLSAMLDRLDVQRALLRGRYMAAASSVEWNGIPIDVSTLSLLREHWQYLQDELIRAIDGHYGVFEGRSFRADRWAEYLTINAIPWPRLASGRLDLSDGTFREMARVHPAVSPMRELRSALSDLRLGDLAVGSDARNRTILSAFRARSGRNAPSNTKFIFGPSVWLRGLIKPAPGYGLAYLDWRQQEFGIASALSGDQGMQAAYCSGDPYLSFAQQAGAVPRDATKATHGPTRELFKACVLAVQYGMEADSLAGRIGQPPVVARDLLRAHRRTYRTFWRWSDGAVDFAMLTGSLHSIFGWHVHVGENSNPRSLRNFPMQANGAEMLRLACCLATERGIEVCAPVHDALLISAPLNRLDEDIARTRAVMVEASSIVLSGFQLETDVSVVRYPHRYADPRGALMWSRVLSLIAQRTAQRGVA